MRTVFFFLLFFFLTPVPLAGAISAGVHDSDPKGANVREAPSRKGNIVNIVKYPAAEDELYSRRVMVEGQNGEWFNVTLQDASRGWMHKSILGFCAGSMENGPCVLRAEPDERARTLVTLPEGARLGFEGAREEWIRVSYRDKDGKTVAGWLPERCATPSGVCLSGEGVVTVRNRTGCFPLLSFTVAAQSGPGGVYLGLEPGQGVALRKPAAGTANLDCHMGMPNNVHFLFENVPFGKVDAMAVRDTDGSSPVLELFFKGKSVGSIAGTMTQEDLRGEGLDDEPGKFAASSAFQAHGLTPPEAPPDDAGAFAGHWKPTDGGDPARCLTIYEDGSWKRGYDKDVADDVPSLGMYVIKEGTLTLHSFTRDHAPGSPAVPGEKIATVKRQGEVLVVTDPDGKAATYGWEDKPAGQF